MMRLLNKVTALQKESQDALGIFEKTVTRLNNINKRIERATAYRVFKAAKLTEDIEKLDAVTARNAKLAAKLSSFLED